MSDPFIFTLGVILVLAVFYDFLRTTISLSGMGFISRFVANTLWSGGSAIGAGLERRTGVSIRGILGPSILISIAAVWVILHLVGYVLMYRGGLSLVQSQSGDPASLIQTIAFAGSALSTLGASTVKVTGGWWDILSMIAAVNGMIVLTLSVSYVLNILQTTNSARIFAVRFRALRSVNGQVSQLGPDLASVVVKLTASSLPGMFVPTDPTMDFPAAIQELCDLMESPDAPQAPELAAAIALLGRNMCSRQDGNDIAAAREWARHYTISKDGNS